MTPDGHKRPKENDRKVRKKRSARWRNRTTPDGEQNHRKKTIERFERNAAPDGTNERRPTAKIDRKIGKKHNARSNVD